MSQGIVEQEENIVQQGTKVGQPDLTFPRQECFVTTNRATKSGANDDSGTFGRPFVWWIIESTAPDIAFLCDVHRAKAMLNKADLNGTLLKQSVFVLVRSAPMLLISYAQELQERKSSTRLAQAHFQVH
jgi:hypothetical protein